MNMHYHFLLFDQFETLDLFGPVEIFGYAPAAVLHYISMDGGIIVSAQGARIHTMKADPLPDDSVLLVPGGMGTRRLVRDAVFLERLRELSDSAAYVQGQRFLRRQGF